MNTKTNSKGASKGSNKGASKGKTAPAIAGDDTSRHPEARANTVESTATLPAVEGAPVSDTRSKLLHVMQQNVEGLQALAKSLPAGSRDQPEKTAGQWVRLRNSINQQFADNFDSLKGKGLLTEEQHAGAIAALRDDKGNSAPIYGAQKLIDTLCMLATGSRANISKLHNAYLATLCEAPQGSDVSNETLAKGIARRAVVSVTGTAPTQRSSSNYALQSLGIITATRTGVQMLNNAAANALRALYVETPAS